MTVIEAAIALAVGFGLELTAEQVALIMAVAITIGNLVQTLWLRSQVTPAVDLRDREGRQLVAKTP